MIYINLDTTFSEVDSPRQIVTEDEDSQMNVFQHFIAELHKKCLTMKELFMRRPHIVEDALEYYKDIICDIICSNYVVFASFLLFLT